MTAITIAGLHGGTLLEYGALVTGLLVIARRQTVAARKAARRFVRRVGE